MTAKRDLKRRVRERQAQTGESYVTALREVRARVVETSAIPVVEMIDVTELARPLGYKVRTTVTPGIADKVDVSATLLKFRDVLLATTRDRELELMRDVVLRGARPQHDLRTAWSFDDLRRFLDRARSGLGGVSEAGTLVAMSIDARQGSLMVLFHLALRHMLAFVEREPSLSLAELGPPAAVAEWEVIPW